MDSILYWNDVALEANRVSHTDGSREQNGPTLSSRALAIVHLAMYDAYAGIATSPTLPLYQSGLPIPVAAGSSAAAAVAAAAHATLSKLFPSQKAFFDLKHAQAGLTGSGLNTGHDFGMTVAQKLLDARKNDPDASDAGYAVSMGPTAHRPDPDNPAQGYHAPFYGDKAKHFTSATVAITLDAPPKTTDALYKQALKEVRGKGIAPEQMGSLPSAFSARNINETLTGIFWGYDGASGLGTPPRLYNQIIRTIAMARGNTEAQNARLFALVNVAMGDAGILAWKVKYIHNLWRPVVGVRENDACMGPAGIGQPNLTPECDPFWLPLGAPNTNSTGKNFTPPFPAYPSGHATFGAAAFHIARLFYGIAPNNHAPDNLCKNAANQDIAFLSEEFNGINKDNKGTVRPKHSRTFPGGLWEMIEENGRSRVYLGVHWVFDAFAVKPNNSLDLSKNIGGVPLGLAIAEKIFANGLHPAP